MLIYPEAPASKLIFDVAVRQRGRLAYLDAPMAALATLLIGYLFVPVVDRIDRFDMSVDELLTRYLRMQSSLKSTLNPKYCKANPHVCEEFYGRFGSNPSEGFIVKQYCHGSLIAVKFVKDEFEELIKLVGRYHDAKYLVSNDSVVPWSEDRYSSYWRRILSTLTGGRQPDDETLRLGYLRYCTNYNVLTSSTAWKNLDPQARTQVQQLITQALSHTAP